MIKKLISFSVIGLAAVALAGCTINVGGSGATTAVDGGVWRSIDSGKSWQQTVSVPVVGSKAASIANVDIRRVVVDPSDKEAIYLATENNGIVYSYDGGNSWRQFKTMTSGRILAIAVDPKNKCVVYAASQNKLYKTTDCGRTWQNPYYHAKADALINDLIIDSQNSSSLFLATSQGEILHSVNGGATWQAVLQEKSTVFAALIADPKDRNIIYAATTQKGIFKTIDNGDTWSSLSEGLKSFTSSSQFRGLAVDSSVAGGLIFASEYSIFKSADGGATWQMLSLLPGAKSTVIYALGVNPSNGQEIYYASLSGLVKSTDGGVTWSSQKLPFSRTAKAITINPADSKIVYLGAFLEKK